MKLRIEQDFSDKYDLSKQYKIGQEIEVAEERAKELLSDERGLVSLVEEVEPVGEEVENPVKEEKPKRKAKKA